MSAANLPKPRYGSFKIIVRFETVGEPVTTVAELRELLSELDLFPAEPQRDVSRLYRRWTFHSAALDLALRQAGRPLHEVLKRPPRPVTFVVSLRLGEPPSLEPVTRRLVPTVPEPGRR